MDSIDDESWYNKWAHPYWRVQRHLQYENYIINDVFPLMWNKNWTPYTAVTGCSFGAYHAINFAFRHPEMVNACISMGGAFDIKSFLDGWYSEDVYFNNPPDYLANCTDGWKYNHMRTVLATGEWDMCWARNEEFAAILRAKGIRHELYVWGDQQLSRLAVVAADGKDVLVMGTVCAGSSWSPHLRFEAALTRSPGANFAYQIVPFSPTMEVTLSAPSADSQGTSIESRSIDSGVVLSLSKERM